MLLYLPDPEKFWTTGEGVNEQAALPTIWKSGQKFPSQKTNKCFNQLKYKT